MTVEEALVIERERNIFLQYKADCWRNVAIEFVNSIENMSPESIQKALDKFNEIKRMFPFVSE